MDPLTGLPVQSLFKITTPSMTVTITADDTPLPANLGPVETPANLVTVNQPRMAAPAPSPRGLAGEQTLTEPAREVEFQDPPTHIPSQLRTTAFEATTVQQHEAADSQEGSFVVEGDLEPHDYTYWDKLRRAGTKTEIRRWRTFGPESLQDTPFMGRNVEVDVPAEAYSQGAYFGSVDETFSPNEYRLPTKAYVTAPVWLRRTQGGLCRTAVCQCWPCVGSR
ncbi:inner membrane complex protein 20 [Cystoisospora suis]|uniref:Inner membrane complex protein 20 n=1 Tax=Cystoisospora suis TaxID=483139 RepID=A0A2C6LHH5_9APIC|nr:inner membrane complex protein 20 [Cystoisospora suis]